MKIEFVNLGSRHPIPRQYLGQKMKKAWRLLLQRGVVPRRLKRELVLVWVSPRRSKSLNLKYKNTNKATDVLSFQIDGPQALGELVLCSEVIKAKAAKNKLSFRDYALYCVLHGTLHLLGFEHEGCPQEARKMFHLQDQIFDLLIVAKISS